MTIGFRILKRDRVVPDDIVAEFAKLPVANVSDSMSRMTAAGTTLRPMHSSGGMAGVALTVKARPGDNLMLHAAIDRAVPGDVIVVDAGGALAVAAVKGRLEGARQALAQGGTAGNEAVVEIGHLEVPRLGDAVCGRWVQSREGRPAP